jgi:hypothetical protein
VGAAKGAVMAGFSQGLADVGSIDVAAGYEAGARLFNSASMSCRLKQDPKKQKTATRAVFALSQMLIWRNGGSPTIPAKPYRYWVCTIS